MSFGFILFLGTYFIFREYFTKYFKSEDVYLLGMYFSILSLCWYIIGFINVTELSSSSPVSFGLYYDRAMYRMAGFGGNPDYFNLFNIIFIVYSYVHMKDNKNKILFLLSILNSLLTFSISAIFSLSIIFIIDFIFFSNIKERINKLFIMIFLSVLVITLLFIFWDMEYLKNIIEVRFKHLETGSGRYEMWKYALTLISDNIISGISINNLRVITFEKFSAVNIHSTYLEIFTEGGIIVFLLFLLFQILLIINLLKVYKLNKNNKYILLAVMCYFVNISFVSATIHESFLFLLLISFTIINKNINRGKKYEK
jgi:O-antigen ligase